MNKLPGGVLTFLNPITHLGDKKYSIWFPLLTTLSSAAVLELYVYFIAHDPDAVGLFAIFIFIALIIYFSFREGIKGGLTTTGVTVAYYFYIIYTRHYVGEQLASGIQTTIVLGLLYFFLAGVIGWLKETIDTLIEREADQKRHLQAIIQQLPVGILISDHNGIIIDANKKIELILGTKIPIGFKIGVDQLLVQAVRNGRTARTTETPIARALTTGRSIVNQEYTITRANGKEAYLQISASVIRNKKGNIIAAAEIISDVSPQKEIEKRKDDFVNMASHELKTPITSMKLYIELLDRYIRKTKNTQARKTIASIHYQTERLQELVSDLLDVSRLQTGKLMFNKEKFRLDSLVKKTIDELQPTAKNRRIVFKNTNELFVNADKFRIYQVLTNLITNAIKYSPHSQEITVQLKQANGKAVVSVQDSGIGIEKDQQKKIFERLYQVSDDVRRTFPGLGMGLYISSRIVKRHNGSIWVKSIPKKGSTFYFSLPLYKS